jgi:hypothetical protein
VQNHHAYSVHGHVTKCTDIKGACPGSISYIRNHITMKCANLEPG